MKPIFICSAVLLAASACAPFEPEVLGGKTPQYQSDLAGCRAQAERVREQEQPVRSGAIVGAVVGGLVGAFDDSGNRAENAVGGALIGAGAGAIEGAEDLDVIERAAVRSCLIERGYTLQS